MITVSYFYNTLEKQVLRKIRHNMTSLYYFIINPKSGSNVDISCVRHLRDYLRERNHRVVLELTRSLEHAGELARDAAAAGAEMVVAAGGDGTVRTVADAMAGTQIPILIIPCGTENLMAGELGLDGYWKTTLSAFEDGLIRQLDLGQINNRHFMAIVGVGFDAEVVRRVHSLRSGHISHRSYIWPICRTFWEHKFPHLRVEADGEPLCDEPALVFVSNISRYAVGLGISPDANVGDGLLDLCIYKCNGKLALISHSLRTIVGTSDKSRSVIRRKCRKISIRSGKGNEMDVPVQIDGDPGPSLPLEIDVIPAAAQVLVPPPPGHSRYHPPIRFYHLRRWLLR